MKSIMDNCIAYYSLEREELMIETVILFSALSTAIAGIVSGIQRVLKKKQGVNLMIDLGSGKKYEVNSKDLTQNQIADLLKHISDDVQPKKTTQNNQEGNVQLDVMLLIIPGIIALAFATTFIYLLIQHQGDAGYKTPDELRTAMTTIIGYYFGIGASTALNKGQTVTPEELAKAIAER